MSAASKADMLYLLQVVLQEDEDGNIHLRNLSAHQVLSLLALLVQKYKY